MTESPTGDYPKRVANYCRHCDLFTGLAGAGTVTPPPEHAGDPAWLTSHCWLCQAPTDRLCAWPVNRPGPVIDCGRYRPCPDHDVAELYGPLGSRWGDPNTHCPDPRCRLGINHTGAHYPHNGYEPIPPLPADELVDERGDQPCNCDRPWGYHRPTCPRAPHNRGHFVELGGDQVITIEPGDGQVLTVTTPDHDEGRTVMPTNLDVVIKMVWLVADALIQSVNGDKNQARRLRVRLEELNQRIGTGEGKAPDAPA